MSELDSVKPEDMISEIMIKDEPLEAPDYCTEEQNSRTLEKIEFVPVRQEIDCEDLKEEERDPLASIDVAPSQVQSHRPKKFILIKVQVYTSMKQKKSYYKGRNLSLSDYENFSQLNQPNNERFARYITMEREMQQKKMQETKARLHAAERSNFVDHQQQLKNEKEKSAQKRAERIEQKQLEVLKQNGESDRIKRLQQKVQTSVVESTSQESFQVEEGKYLCDMCKLPFNSRDMFKKHYLMHFHTDNFSCNYCGEQFFHAYDLVEHVLVHIDSKEQYKCKLYLSEHTSLGTLLEHCEEERKSVSEGPDFECEICNKHFCFNRHYKMHLRSHGEPIIIKTPFLCEVCGKIITTSKGFGNHQRIHTGEKPFVCNECGKSFSAYKYLHYHERVHTGVKPYKCDECGRTFSKRSTLVTHSKIHTGKRPYDCTVCGKNYYTTNSLKTHMKIHTVLKKS